MCGPVCPHIAGYGASEDPGLTSTPERSGEMRGAGPWPAPHDWPPTPYAAIRFGRMPEAEKRKLVAGLAASEGCQHNPQLADLKAFSKHIYNAYLKNFNMTKKKARSILTGKSSHNAVSVTGQPSHEVGFGAHEGGVPVLPQAWPLMGLVFSPLSSTTSRHCGRQRRAWCGSSW